MNHLTQTGYGYFEHLLRAWRIAGVLLVHGLVPNVWKDKASDMLCKNDSTRKYLLEKHYGIYEAGGRDFNED